MINKMVTAIISTHMRPINILKRAIQSVLNQTYSNFELIIVNDAPDYAGNIEIAEYVNSLQDKRIDYIINDEKPGACASRNIGIRKANGEFVALLDDDDEWCSTKLEEMLPLFSDENIGLVFCDYDNIKDDKPISRKKPILYTNDAFTHLLSNNFIGGCSVPIIRTCCFEKSGLFDEELPSCQDIDMWLRIAKDYQIVYLDKVLVHYYISGNSITGNYKRRVTGWNMILKKYSVYFESNQSARRQWQKNVVTVQITYGSVKEALHYYFEYFKGTDRIQQGSILLEGLVKKMLYFLFNRRT